MRLRARVRYVHLAFWWWVWNVLMDARPDWCFHLAERIIQSDEDLWELDRFQFPEHVRVGRRLVHRDLADRCSGSCASCDLVTCNAPPVTVPVVKPGEVRVLFGFLLALYTGAWIGLVSAALSFIT